jgi:hypothetical protein
MVKGWLRDIAGPQRGEPARDYAKRQILHWTRHDEMVQLGKKGRAAPPLTQEEIDLLVDRLGRGEALSAELSEKVIAIVRRSSRRSAPKPRRSADKPRAMLECRDRRGRLLSVTYNWSPAAALSRTARKRGPDPSVLDSRDTMIRWTIANLVKHCGLKATRRRSTTKIASAASIVAEVLNELGEKSLTERRVNNIWYQDPFHWWYRPPST